MSTVSLFLCCVLLPGSGDRSGGGSALAAICRLQPPIASNQSCRGGVTLGSRSGSFHFSLEVSGHAEREEVALVKPSGCDASASTLNDCDQAADTCGKALREEIFDFLSRTRCRVIKVEATEQLRKTHKPKKAHHHLFSGICQEIKDVLHQKKKHKSFVLNILRLNGHC